MCAADNKPASYATGKDMLLLPNGTTYHLGIKAGDVFPRIVTVGAHDRALLLAENFDEDKPVNKIESARMFLTLSGYYKGVGVTIIAIGMGAPMMDFMIREVSYVCPGPLAVIRFGTCGLFNPTLAPGTIVCATKGSSYVYVNYAHHTGSFNCNLDKTNSPPFIVCKPVLGSVELDGKLAEALEAEGASIYRGLNCCGETFYSCQGRIDGNFNDNNEEVMKTLLDATVDFVEMETHQLFHLASVRKEKCYAAASAVGIVSRTGNSTQNVDKAAFDLAIKRGGKASMEAVVAFNF